MCQAELSRNLSPPANRWPASARTPNAFSGAWWSRPTTTACITGTRRFCRLCASR
nr:MAG TPA: hypothetical protein [Caudoviricetes sp.]